jgi:hypothetical protein
MRRNRRPAIRQGKKHLSHEDPAAFVEIDR